MEYSLGTVPLVWWFLYVIINSASFLVMLWDKMQSRKSGAERIPEGVLFFLAACFGSAGIFLGMFVLRHKTRQWHFLLGIPLLLAENMATLLVVLSFVD
mgnify:CR=1